MRDTQRRRVRRRERERIGCRGRRRPQARIRLVKVRPLTGSWILSTRFFHSLTPFPSGACFGEEDGSWLKEGWWETCGPKTLTLTLAPEPQIWARNMKQQMWGNRFMGLVFCPLWTMPDRQSDKGRLIKDRKILAHQVPEGGLTHKCICG